MSFPFKPYSIGLVALGLNTLLFANAYATTNYPIISTHPTCYSVKKHCKKPCPKTCCAPWTVGLEALYLAPSQLGSGDASSSSTGAALVKPSYHWGFALNANYGIPRTNNDFGLNWTSINTTDNANNTNNIPKTTSERVNYGFNSLTAEMGHTFYNPDMDFRVGVGIQYVSLNFASDQVISSLISAGSGEGTGNVLNIADQYRSYLTRGIGPRISANARYNLMNSGFYLVGGLAGGLLYATTSGSLCSCKDNTGAVIP